MCQFCICLCFAFGILHRPSGGTILLRALFLNFVFLFHILSANCVFLNFVFLGGTILLRALFLAQGRKLLPRGKAVLLSCQSCNLVFLQSVFFAICFFFAKRFLFCNVVLYCNLFFVLQCVELSVLQCGFVLQCGKLSVLQCDAKQTSHFSAICIALHCKQTQASTMCNVQGCQTNRTILILLSNQLYTAGNIYLGKTWLDYQTSCTQFSVGKIYLG